MDLKALLRSAFALVSLPAAALIAADTAPIDAVEIDGEVASLSKQVSLDQPMVDGAVDPASYLGGDFVGGLLPPRQCCDPFWYAGAEVVFVDIDAKTGGSIILAQLDSTAPGVSTVGFRDGDGLNDTGYAPRLWVGRRLGDTWAVQGRYWNLSQNDAFRPAINPAIPPVGTNFATYTEADRLEAYTIDLDLVRSSYYEAWKFDTFVGARHASFGIDSQIHGFGVFTTGNFTNLFLANGSSFDGTGVTYGLAARRRLANTHAHLYVSARGAALSGQTDSYGRSAGTIASSPSAPLVGAATVTRANADADMYMAEIQLGIEWNYGLRSLPANFFFRTAYEYQDWNIKAPPTGGAGFGGTIGELTTSSFAAAGIGDMQLNGVAIATGLTW